MSRAIDLSSRRNGSIATGSLTMIAMVVTSLAIGIIAWITIVDPDTDEDQRTNYGFDGDVRLVGAMNHEIVYEQGVGEEILYSLGEYLERIEYFNSSYGGVVQIRRNDMGYTVYLTYSKRYWNLPDFAEEVAGIKEDLESNVIMAPVRIVLVDEDEEGVHHSLLEDVLKAL